MGGAWRYLRSRWRAVLYGAAAVLALSRGENESAMVLIGAAANDAAPELGTVVDTIRRTNHKPR